jgi:hypothetical protein
MRAVLSAVFATALVLAIQATPAAAAPLTFVSATGNDGNPCTVQAAPCKTLQKAISVTPAGGEIRILSQLPSQNAIIATSLTVNGGGHTMIGTVSINSASAIVTLRNLSLTGLGIAARGIDIINAAVVHIEGCTVERFAGDGIHLAANVSTELFVSNSVMRDNSEDGLEAVGPTTARVSIDNSRLLNNDGYGAALNDTQASVFRSVASGNAHGFGAGGTINIVESTATANGAGFIVFTGGEMTLESCVARGNDYGFLAIIAAVARLSNSVFTNNGKGVSNNLGNNDSTILTSGNNVIAGNTQNLDGATVLTPLTPQ